MTLAMLPTGGVNSKSAIANSLSAFAFAAVWIALDGKYPMAIIKSFWFALDGINPEYAPSDSEAGVNVCNVQVL
jgi:hypothetical protein